MKTRTNLLFACLLSALCLVVVATSSNGALLVAGEHFSVKEYNEFHDVLHPLQHEALPKKDFATIRAKAGELTTLGGAIVKLGLPVDVKDAAAFETELKNFAGALARFKTDAASTNNAKLEASYLAVHDSFEMLAGMLPRKQQESELKAN